MRKALNGEWKEWEVSVKIPKKLSKIDKQFLKWIEEMIDHCEKNRKKRLDKLIWKRK